MKAQHSRIDRVFVYGTLKRGQCRESAWPVVPQSVTRGWVRGTLWGRADYPALMPGGSRVCGEVYRFDPESLGQVLSVLDRIEGTDGNSEDDLYHRLVVDVFLTAADAEPGDVDPADPARCEKAFAYFYNRDPEQDGFGRVPVLGGTQRWPS